MVPTIIISSFPHCDSSLTVAYPGSDRSTEQSAEQCNGSQLAEEVRHLAEGWEGGLSSPWCQPPGFIPSNLILNGLNLRKQRLPVHCTVGIKSVINVN